MVRVANRLLLLNYGKLIVEGSPQEVVSSAQAVQAYLGTSAEVER